VGESAERYFEQPGTIQKLKLRQHYRQGRQPMFPALPQHTIRQDWAVAAIPAFYALVYFVSMTFFAARYPAEVPYRFSLDGSSLDTLPRWFWLLFSPLGLILLAAMVLASLDTVFTRQFLIIYWGIDGMAFGLYLGIQRAAIRQTRLCRSVVLLFTLLTPMAGFLLLHVLHIR
jgi:hypothetical protein